jgi:putative hydrolase of the HAD superfamily
MNKLPFDFIVLDLDDTIYPEQDFVKSGFNYLAYHYSCNYEVDNLTELMLREWKQGGDAISYLFETLKIENPPIQEALSIYRTHLPKIKLDSLTFSFFEQLDILKVRLGLISDGRSITQRNKLRALGIESKFDKIVISEEFGSEKPNIRNFEVFISEYPDSNFCYIGDNTNKDFDSPDKLGWYTFCLISSGHNIHFQDFSNLPSRTKKISKLSDVLIL